MDTLRKFKITQSALKLLVVGLGIGLTIYVGLLCLGLRHWTAEVVCTILGHSLLFVGAWIFRLCWISWLFIFYILLVRICMILHGEGLFGEYVDLAHYVVFGIGSILTLIFICNIKKVFKHD